MKKKISLLLLVIMMMPIASFSQNYWKTYRKADGLIDSVVIDLAISSNKIYIATPRGFSVFENETFTNYDTSNSDLLNQNIKIIRQFNDTVYMVHDSGLTQFIDGSITNYTVDSGLLSNSITDIEIDSRGELWIASTNGISRKIGNSFLNDPTKVVYDIAINSGDSVYANVNNRAIANVASPVTAEMYFNNVWVNLRDTSLKNSILNARFVNLSNGRVGITSTNSGAYLVDSLFNLKQFALPDDNLQNSLLSSMEIDSDSNYWFSMGSLLSFSTIGGIYKFDDNSYDLYQNGLPNNGVTTIKHSNAKLHIGTYNGFAIASDSVPYYPQKMTIETASIKASFSSSGSLFYDSSVPSSGLVSGFEFPKGSGKYLIYSGGLWLGSNVSDQEVYLSTTEVTPINFRSGTVNNNHTAINPNMIYITKSEISFHLKNYNTSNYTMPESIRNWPANGRVELGEAVDQAPFIDVNNNGCYDPENGDYPAILGDQAIYMVVSDDTEEAKGAFNFRFKAEAHYLIYVYDRPGVDYIDQSVFIRLALVNRSNRTYNNVNVGMALDYDVGYAIDDAVGCDRSSNIFYAYNADLFDQSQGITQGYEEYIPYIGTKIINRTLTGHIAYGNSIINRRPRTSGGYRNSLDMLWNDSTAISVGGDGYNRPVLTPTEYLYPGRLERMSEWSYLNQGAGFANDSSGNEVFSVGRTTLNQWLPGERKIIDYVIGAGMDSNNINTYNNYKVVLSNLDKAARFQKGIDSITPFPSYSACVTGIADYVSYKKEDNFLNVYPNPNNGELNLIANEGLKSVRIFDMQGKIILTLELNESKNIQSIFVPDGYKNGLYLLQAITKNGKPLSKQFILQR